MQLLASAQVVVLDRLERKHLVVCCRLNGERREEHTRSNEVKGCPETHELTG